MRANPVESSPCFGTLFSDFEGTAAGMKSIYYNYLLHLLKKIRFDNETCFYFLM